MIDRLRSTASVLLAAACAILLGAPLSPSVASPACSSLDRGQPWNRPAPRERHPLSAQLSKQLWYSGGDRPGNINMLPSYAVYVTTAADPLYRVSSRRGNMDGESIPFRNGWRTYHSDQQLIVFAGDRIYEFYEARIDHAARTIRAVRAERLAANQRSNPPSRGIGIPYVHMLILECEVREGRIRHALSLRVGRPRCNEAWFPASKVENHPDCRNDGIPIGARYIMQFPKARVEAWAAGLRRKGGVPLERLGRSVAAALQTYGFYVTDNGAGAAGLDIQHPRSFAADTPLRSTNIEAIRDLLDGLVTEGDISLVAETGRRIHDPR